MKLRTATPASIAKIAKLALIVVCIFVVTIVAMQMTQKVSADKFDDQINALQQDIDNYNIELSKLASQSSTLQSTIAGLQSQAAVIQAQIDISQAKYDQLVSQIADTEKKIIDNQDALGKTIADLYVDDKISPIEMLASSKNIGDYMDKQEYRSSVRNELVATIGQIKDLKALLEKQRIEAERVLTDQKNQHLVLVAKQNEQQQLLSDTKGQESAYQQLSSQNSAEISKLRTQQAAELAARARSSGGGYTSLPGDGTKGGYPSYWMSLPLDGAIDPWGMYTRECVSYTAFKVNQAYGNMPYWGGIGNANMWDDNARRIGIPIGTTPKPGSVAVANGGYYGHVAWVEKVNGDGTINISHFNINWNGDYAEWNNLSLSFFDYYIYFGEW